MSDAISVFDRDLLRRRRSRAACGDYAAHDFLFKEGAARLADRLLDVSREFPLALDLGCHQGELGEALAGNARIGQLLQAEVSPRMAAHAGRHLPTAVADEEWLPFAEKSLDLVLSNLNLHWVNDLPGTLIQINRILRPDGLFLAGLLGGETLTELRQSLMEAEIEVLGGASPRVSPFADLRDMGALMQRAGFALPVVDSDLVTVTYDNMFKLLADLRGMGETSVIRERLKRPAPRALFLRAAEIYHQRFAGEDGRIPATFQIIYLHGWAPDALQQKPLAPGSAAQRLADVLGVEETALPDKAGFVRKKD